MPASTGLSTNRAVASAISWITGRMPGWRQADRAAAADRPAERPPDDVDDLVDVLVGLAPLGGGPDAAADVVLEDQDRQRVDGRPERGGLLEDVDAVLLALDHPGDAADLALHPRQAADELGLVLRVAVAEMARVGRCGSRGAPRSDSSVVGSSCVAFGRGAGPHDDTPWGYVTTLRVAERRRAPLDWPPMDPRDRPARSQTAPRAPPAGRPSRPAGSGSSPAATTSPSSSSTAGCGSAALALLIAGTDPDAGPVLDVAADGRRSRGRRRSIGTSDRLLWTLDALRPDLAAWQGDLVGWLDAIDPGPGQSRGPGADG